MWPLLSMVLGTMEGEFSGNYFLGTLSYLSPPFNQFTLRPGEAFSYLAPLPLPTCK